MEDYDTFQNVISDQLHVISDKLYEFFEVNIEPIRKDFNMQMEVDDQDMIVKCLRIFHALFELLKKQYKGIKGLFSLTQMEIENAFNLMIIFSIIWSVASNICDKLNPKNRVKISQFLKSKMLKIYINFPLEGEVFDYYVDFEKLKFGNWSNLV